VPIPELSGQRVTLRPVRPGDRDRLREILAQPGVARWWGPGSADHSVDEWLTPDESVTQYLEENGEDYRHASIDLFLDGEHQGHGLGPDAIRTVARHLFEERGHHRVTIDPAASNERAIRAYERVGFRQVGRMRNYERGADGTWHDGMLMDLLVGELDE
jgi:aminoglycoside 6'-N-acetyltransferase